MIRYIPLEAERTVNAPSFGFGYTSKAVRRDSVGKPPSSSMQVSKETAKVRVLDCPQAFTPRTVTLPAAVPQVHVMLVVFWPAVIVAPVGTVHNCVTPVTAGVVKFTPTWFGQTLAGPVMLAGVAGKRVSDALRAALPPHKLTA